VGGDHKVIFGPQSRSDLKSIVAYVREASGSPEVAERLGMALVEKALTLSAMPERGRVVPELSLPEVREIIFKTGLSTGSPPSRSRSCASGMPLAAHPRLTWMSFGVKSRKQEQTNELPDDELLSARSQRH
jgi:plasmid stabilization system protein ParE